MAGARRARANASSSVTKRKTTCTVDPRVTSSTIHLFATQSSRAAVRSRARRVSASGWIDSLSQVLTPPVAGALGRRLDSRPRSRGLAPSLSRPHRRPLPRPRAPAPADVRSRGFGSSRRFRARARRAQHHVSRRASRRARARLGLRATPRSSSPIAPLRRSRGPRASRAGVRGGRGERRRRRRRRSLLVPGGADGGGGCRFERGRRRDGGLGRGGA